MLLCVPQLLTVELISVLDTKRLKDFDKNNFSPHLLSTCTHQQNLWYYTNAIKHVLLLTKELNKHNFSKVNIVVSTCTKQSVLYLDSTPRFQHAIKVATAATSITISCSQPTGSDCNDCFASSTTTTSGGVPAAAVTATNCCQWTRSL